MKLLRTCCLFLGFCSVVLSDESFILDDELDPVEFGQIFRSTFIPTGPSTGRKDAPMKKEFYVANLEHSFDELGRSGVVHKRGRVSYRTSATPHGPLGALSNGGNAGQPQAGGLGGSNGAMIRQTTLESGEVERLLETAARGGVYRLHVEMPSVAAERDPRLPATTTLWASVPACELVAAGLRDHLTLHVDALHGGLVAVDYAAVGSPADAAAAGVGGDCSGIVGAARATELLAAAPLQWNTTVRISFGVEAPRPIARPPAPAAADKEKEKQESFFSKYWMWILGAGMVVLVNLLGGGMEEAAGGQRQGAGGSRAASARARR
eukprot:TRINITY_DN32718_c0_g1_i1.p1 TRINITY_DN32718_c0_g1~~TRINITY_DN32718_c0_g1_i1.p1  ORF type:complete len:322 (+),score=80.86 TRINITY_DN32718_c0_g1_i1:28-993(+)